MRNVLLSLISAVALTCLVACGGGSSTTISVPAPPSGGNPVGFTNASLSGSYVFTANGITANNSFAVAGMFTADGSGNITSGTRDTVNDAGGQALGESITGSYSVNSDGRGELILNSSSGQVIYFFVLSSPSAGKLFQDGTAKNSVVTDAIGRIELQTSTATTLTGTYIVRLDGEDTNLFPYAVIGGLTASGTTLSGTVDENDAEFFTPLFSSSGNYSLTGSRGLANFTTPTGGTHNFIFYYVSPSRLELISTDKKFWLHGYADQQSTGVLTLTGDQVFNISGYYGNAPIAETGRFTMNAGTISNGFEDYNSDFTFNSDVGFAGSYVAPVNGRWTANLSTLGDSLVGWQVSSSQSLVLAYNSLSSNILETGEMRAQNLAVLSSASIAGNNYAQAFAGTDRGLGNFESTGNYLGGSSGSLEGAIDFQTDADGLTQNYSATGSY